MVNITKLQVGDFIYAGPDGKNKCQILEITDGKLICNMFSMVTNAWLPVRIRLKPEECYLYK